MEKAAWIWVMSGGALGSLARYGISRIPVSSVIPWSTMGVNLLGSFLIGILSGLFNKGNIGQGAHWFLVTGLMGGFTTFSAFSLENIQLMQAGFWTQAVIYITISLAGGLLLCAIGLKLTSQF